MSLAVYIYGLERVSQNRSGTLRWYLADGQGSVWTLTDEAGLVSDTYDYTGFGEMLASSGSTLNDFKYVGEQLDPNSGLYYNRARWMDPKVGRFTGVDPYAGDPQAPVSLHRYLYANASPVSFRDPSGQVTLVEMVNVVVIATSLYSIAHGSYQIGQGDIADGAIDVAFGFMGIGVWKPSVAFVRYLASPVNKAIRIGYLGVLESDIPQAISVM